MSLEIAGGKGDVSKWSALQIPTMLQVCRVEKLITEQKQLERSNTRLRELCLPVPVIFTSVL